MERSDTKDNPRSVPRDELQVITSMLKTAKEYGLAAEVVKSFGEYRLSGSDVAEAAEAALYDWDL